MYINNIKKKYFLLWLPVYGTTARSGDHCWYITYPDKMNVPATVYKDNNQLFLYFGNPHPIYNNEPKAELFLVTNDIQIGDIVSERQITGEFEQYEIHTLNDIDLKNQVKVIGKPSTEATWVHEFNEFSEDEIESGGGQILYYNSKMTHWSKEKDKDYQYIKLKCDKCNTFH